MSDTSNEQQQAAAAVRGLTAYAILARLLRVRVRDDGSCWIYVVLAALFALDHARISSSEEAEEEEEDALDTNDADAEASSEPKPKKRKKQSAKKKKAKKKKAKKKKTNEAAARDGIEEPSERDRASDLATRSRLYEEQRDRLGKDAESVMIVPEGDTMGWYGGIDHFLCLAIEFGVDIVLYDENDTEGLRNPSRLWLLLSSSGENLILTADQIQQRMDDPDRRGVPVLHVAASRDIQEHFEVYRYTDDTLSSYEFPSWFREFQKNVANAL